jgi:hypothetical protein
MNRVKYATLVEMMQGVSDDEVTMSNKKFTGIFPKIKQDSIASTTNVTRNDKNFNSGLSNNETGRFNKQTPREEYALYEDI